MKRLVTYEQYCAVVGRNVILQEMTDQCGRKKLRCLDLHECSPGGCTNKYVIARACETEKKEK